MSFFVRLIWQESRFRPDVVSRAGARGIAQFMPGTARERGLANGWTPIQSLHKSADFLRELREQFGNLGLAAAAYNGGPGRVRAWGSTAAADCRPKHGNMCRSSPALPPSAGAAGEPPRFRTKEFQIKFRARRWLRWRPRTRTSSGRCRQVRQVAAEVRRAGKGQSLHLRDGDAGRQLLPG